MKKISIHKKKDLSLLFFAILLFSGLLTPALQAQDTPYIRFQEPDYLTFNELKKLSRNPEPEGLLGDKLAHFWKTPIISNEAYYEGHHYKPKNHRTLGPFFQVTTWNIEKSLQITDAITAFTNSDSFENLIRKDNLSDKHLKKILRQQKRLKNSDIIVLQEMDIGVKRSGYRDAARELAQAMNMNYAYGTEQLEIDPAILGTEDILFEDGLEDTEAEAFFRADPKLYKGLFGVAVLSKWPIKNVQVFQLDAQPYDWYWQEKEKTTFLEDARRIGTKLLFQNEITREMKVGGRIFFRVDLDVPEIEGGTLTIINVHMEIKCLPQGREEQMAEILGYIENIKNPVIMLGDFNSADKDISPTSVTRTVRRAAKNPTTWLDLGVKAVVPQALLVNVTRATSTITKNLQDPLANDIKVIAPNPVKGLFDMLQNFHFDDQKTFDFRGDKNRSMGGKEDTLANSNQRDFKGFVTTFKVKRPIAGFIGKYRLDWVLVKSYLHAPEDPIGSYKLAPHFGETLELLNTSLLQEISDHHPSVVDIPFGEPNLPR